MSESVPRQDVDSSYGELLGEYFTVVAEIAPILDEFGRPQPEHHPEYSQLRARKHELHEALEQATPDHETTEIKAILDEAFSDR